MKKNINAERHWNRFLQTGKIDDFLSSSDDELKEIISEYLKKFLEEKNSGDVDFKYTFMHVIMAALAKAIYLRPK